jgi:fatty acid-binding protein DegV
MLIVTDAAVDLPPVLEFSGRVRVVAGDIWVGDDLFQGPRDEFWSILRRGTFLSTTPPTVNALADAYRHDDLVLGVHVSAELSATVTRAHAAAQRAGAGVVVVDSRSLSLGYSLVPGREGRRSARVASW